MMFSSRSNSGVLHNRAVLFTLDALVAAFLVLLASVIIFQQLRPVDYSTSSMIDLSQSALFTLKLTGGLQSAVLSNASLVPYITALPTSLCANLTVFSSTGTVLTHAGRSCTGVAQRVTTSFATFSSNDTLYRAKMVVWYS